jgi:hypothetical protein
MTRYFFRRIVRICRYYKGRFELHFFFELKIDAAKRVPDTIGKKKIEYDLFHVSLHAERGISLTTG